MTGADMVTDAATDAIAVDSLSKRFGSQDAVRDLTLRVKSGELFGIVGPDGAGKTTTLRMLAGILRPTAGEAYVRGVSVRDDPEGVKRSIAYMSQRFGLYEDLTVAENLAFYADLYRVPKKGRAERLERLYEFSSLGPFRARLAGQLSGGMKQKLGLSCALVHEPEILLLDEPTFGVDPISRRDLWLIVHDRIRDGVTVVVSTSYLDEAERCDRVALLHRGTLLALDEPERIQRTVASRAAGERYLEVRSSDPRSVRDRLRSMPAIRSATLFGGAVHVLADASEDPETIERALREAGLSITAVNPLEPSLEDAFIALVSEADLS